VSVLLRQPGGGEREHHQSDRNQESTGIHRPAGPTPSTAESPPFACRLPEFADLSGAGGPIGSLEQLDQVRGHDHEADQGE
jgi:hypothetical protein